MVDQYQNQQLRQGPIGLLDMRDQLTQGPDMDSSAYKGGMLGKLLARGIMGLLGGPSREQVFGPSVLQQQVDYENSRAGMDPIEKLRSGVSPMAQNLGMTAAPTLFGTYGKLTPKTVNGSDPNATAAVRIAYGEKHPWDELANELRSRGLDISEDAAKSTESKYIRIGDLREPYKDQFGETVFLPLTLRYSYHSRFAPAGGKSRTSTDTNWEFSPGSRPENARKIADILSSIDRAKSGNPEGRR